MIPIAHIENDFPTCNHFSPKRQKRAEIFIAFLTNIRYTDSVRNTGAGVFRWQHPICRYFFAPC